MSLLDHIDPELRHVVEAVRKDPSSLFWRGGAGAIARDLGSERVRPMSHAAATRKAEAYLLDKHREELATWLLRGVHLAWQRLDPLGDNDVLEEPQVGRLRWDEASLHAGLRVVAARASLDPVGSAAGGDLLGRLACDPGLDDLLVSVNLAARLAPLSECALFGAQIEIALGNPLSATRAAQSVKDGALRPFGVSWKRSWIAFAAWRLGQIRTAAEEYDRALSASTELSPTLLASRLLVAIAEGRRGEVERHVRRVEVDTSDPERTFRWLARSVESETRREPSGTSALLLPTLEVSGPPSLQRWLTDAKR